MPLINWNKATVDDLHGFTTDFIRHELSRRNLETTGSEDEMIERLLADIAHNHQLSGIPDSTAEQSVLTLSTQVLGDLLQQLVTLSQRPTVPVQVTTLSDHSASLPTFSGDGSISAHQWLEELEHTQGLPSWIPSTLLAVALDWKSVAGNHCDTWENFKGAFENQFGDRLTLLQWPHLVTRRVQSPSESLVDYSLAKLRVISRYPVLLTDPQRIEYALQGVRDAHLATTIAAQRPSTVSAFLDIAIQLDRTMEHFSVFPSQLPVAVRTPSRAPPMPAQQGEDWFEAAHAERLVRPPHPTEIQHPSAGVVMRCLEKNEELPDVKSQEPIAAPLCTNDATLEMPFPQLRDARIGPHLREEVTAVQHVLRQRVDLLATGDNALGLCKGTEYSIDLVPDASPYAREPYRYNTEDCSFIERQCQELQANVSGTKKTRLDPELFRTASQLLQANKLKAKKDRMPRQAWTKLHLIVPVLFGTDARPKLAEKKVVRQLDMNVEKMKNLEEYDPAEWIKVRDDPVLLEASLKRRKKRRQQRRKKWDSHTQRVKQREMERQQKRRHNIKACEQTKLQTKMKRLKKKDHIVPGF
ncbi:hypothetical protein HPB52_001191 [Rhipicephalus sanguineus]|uniref:SAP domain-containing protein n=1 Tax=Rhipicephalus sanguineus TaxID=34632 RepID=A0A9D4PUW2_RHISA|nr:hypothetical protein HPB52_001191 [Rhipicephalus sanguineus]